MYSGDATEAPQGQNLHPVYTSTGGCLAMITVYVWGMYMCKYAQIHRGHALL